MGTSDWRVEYPKLKRGPDGVLHGVGYYEAIPVVRELGDGYVARGLVSEVDGRLVLTSVDARYEGKGDPSRGLTTEALRRVTPSDAANAAAAEEYRSNIGWTIDHVPSSFFDVSTRVRMQRGADRYAIVAMLYMQVWNETGGRRGVYRELAARWKLRFREDLSAEQLRTLVFEARHTHGFLALQPTSPPQPTHLLEEYRKTLPQSRQRGKKQ